MLIVSIHDVAPPFLGEVSALRARLARWGVGAVTLLAVPDHHRRAPLERDPATVCWLRARAAAGDEVALHGLVHRQERPARRRDRLRAAVLTAGEGEMLGLAAADAPRLARARAGLAALIGAEVGGFVAPAWLEPRGFEQMLVRAGFAWHETAFALERLRGTPRRHRSPVIGFATRSRWREHAAIAWSALLAPLLERRATTAAVRVALHPGDVRGPAVMDAAERAVRRLLARHPPVTTSTALRASADPPR